MDKFTLMRLSELQDEDALDFADLPPEELNEKPNFRAKYKEFYSDIKIDVSEDW